MKREFDCRPFVTLYCEEEVISMPERLTLPRRNRIIGLVHDEAFGVSADDQQRNLSSERRRIEKIIEGLPRGTRVGIELTRKSFLNLQILEQ